MKILIDTNIFIDMFQKRMPFMEASARVVESCVVGQNTGYVSAHSVSDMHCANKLQLDFIVTRNVKDSVKSPISAVTAVDFVKWNL